MDVAVNLISGFITGKTAKNLLIAEILPKPEVRIIDVRISSFVYQGMPGVMGQQKICPLACSSLHDSDLSHLTHHLSLLHLLQHSALPSSCASSRQSAVFAAIQSLRLLPASRTDLQELLVYTRIFQVCRLCRCDLHCIW